MGSLQDAYRTFTCSLPKLEEAVIGSSEDEPSRNELEQSTFGKVVTLAKQPEVDLLVAVSGEFRLMRQAEKEDHSLSDPSRKKPR
jgi:hypothetical protein